jgi:hypothetical protein
MARSVSELGHRCAGIALVLLFSVAACTNASGTEDGGEVRLGPTPTQQAAPEDAGEDACSNTGVDAGFGSGWSDLYRDYFGPPPTGVASCAGTVGACHGEPSGMGAVSSNFVCAGGVQGCYAGITSPSAGLVTVGDTTDDPTDSSLYAVLRKACIGGEMPKQPANFFFSAADMKRITDWIGAGAPNN